MEPPRPAPESYVENPFSHPSLVSNQGAIIQFINNNSNDATNIIGAIRICESEGNAVQAYLHRNEAELKNIGIMLLDRQLKKTANPIGLTESGLSVDDYAFTMGVASVTDQVKNAHPYNRREGGLWTLNIPAFLDPIPAWIHPDPRPCDQTKVLIINAYIHLHEPSKRATTVLKKYLDDARAEQLKSKDEPPKKVHFGPNKGRNAAPQQEGPHFGRTTDWNDYNDQEERARARSASRSARDRSRSRSRPGYRQQNGPYQGNNPGFRGPRPQAPRFNSNQYDFPALPNPKPAPPPPPQQWYAPQARTAQFQSTPPVPSAPVSYPPTADVRDIPLPSGRQPCEFSPPLPANAPLPSQQPMNPNGQPAVAAPVPAGQGPTAPSGQHVQQHVSPQPAVNPYYQDPVVPQPGSTPGTGFSQQPVPEGHIQTNAPGHAGQPQVPQPMTSPTLVPEAQPARPNTPLPILTNPDGTLGPRDGTTSGVSSSQDFPNAKVVTSRRKRRAANRALMASLPGRLPVGMQPAMTDYTPPESPKQVGTPTPQVGRIDGNSIPTA